MYLFILSQNFELKNTLIPIIDNILVRNHLRNLNLYSHDPFTPNDFQRLSEKNLNCYVFLDTSAYPDVLDTLDKVYEILPNGLFGILSDTDRYAPALLNTAYSIFGYINLWSCNYIDALTSLLTTLNRKYRSLTNGLCIWDAHVCRVIPYSDIYYIETQKGTHLCIAHCNYGVYTFRSHIKTLIYELDYRFLIVKSSIIANISAVKYMDISKRFLYFERNVYCSYAQIYQHDIRKNL